MKAAISKQAWNISNSCDSFRSNDWRSFVESEYSALISEIICEITIIANKLFYILNQKSRIQTLATSQFYSFNSIHHEITLINFEMSLGNFSVNCSSSNRVSLISQLCLVLSIKLTENGGINRHRFNFAKVEKSLIKVSEILIGVDFIDYTVWLYYLKDLIIMYLRNFISL